MRATLRLSSPAWLAAPRYTSAIRAGSSDGLRARSALITTAPRSSGRTAEKAPPNLPIGVRTASTTYTCWPCIPPPEGMLCGCRTFVSLSHITGSRPTSITPGGGMPRPPGARPAPLRPVARARPDRDQGLRSGRRRPDPQRRGQVTGLTRAAARRFLLTLTDLGYVRQEGKRFALTPQVLDLGYAFLSGLPLPGLAEPHLERLSSDLHESSSMSVLDGSDIVYVAQGADLAHHDRDHQRRHALPGLRHLDGPRAAGRPRRRARSRTTSTASTRAVHPARVTDVTGCGAGSARCAPGLRARRPGARARPAVARGAGARPSRRGGRRGQRVDARQPSHPGRLAVTSCRRCCARCRTSRPTCRGRAEFGYD